MPETVETLVEDDRWNAVPVAALARRSCHAVLAHLGLDPGCYEVAVMACNDARMARLNAEFRDLDKPTNVLSWPALDLAPDRPGGTPAAVPVATAGPAQELGDIAVAYETCMREADEQGISLADHVTHLLVHGCLHLLGYDHVHDADAALMEGLETAILAKLGVANPY